MAEPHWTGYVGMGTGLIGAITGIAGAIMGYISYRKSNRLKALDLRLELRKAVSDVHADLDRLKALIDDANGSRQAVFAARGMSQSGAMEIWKNEVKADKAKIGELFKRALKVESTYDTLEAKELESEVVVVHKYKSKIRRLLDKYSGAIRSDDEQRKQIREDQRVRRSPRT
ncbi:MAG: hypothetical protein BA863_18335 [Desulfovibrio sp. S3730MH75]|nr:MAG: hypothetical protein BA863_18335 [Desulfovibrio sp. S3730MH75]